MKHFAQIHQDYYSTLPISDFVGWYDKKDDNYYVYQLSTKYIERLSDVIHGMFPRIQGWSAGPDFKDVV